MVFFSTRLGRKMTRGSGGREREDLRPGKYYLPVFYLTCALQAMKYEAHSRVDYERK